MEPCGLHLLIQHSTQRRKFVRFGLKALHVLLPRDKVAHETVIVSLPQQHPHGIFVLLYLLIHAYIYNIYIYIYYSIYIYYIYMGGKTKQ